MALTDKEVKILAACSLDAEIPVHEIARSTGLTESTVRHALVKLEESGRVKRVTYIDVYPLGFFYFHVAFRPLPDVVKRPEVLAFLKGSPHVSYISQTSGDFQFHTDIIARNWHDLLEFFDTLVKHVGGIFAEKRISLIESLVDYPWKFLGSGQRGTKTLGFGSKREEVEISELDHLILKYLSGNPLSSTPHVARMVGAKVTTVQYRIDRLRNHGVIVGSRFLIDPTRLGFQVFYIHVETHGVSAAMREKMYTFAEREAAVYAILRTIGHYDFLLEVAVQNPSEVDTLMTRLADQLGPGLMKASAHPVIHFHKISFYPIHDYPALTRILLGE